MAADDTILSAEQGHNRSAQQGVDASPDPVLDLSNEHHHAHLHHGQAAAVPVPSEKDDIMFAKSTDGYVGTSSSPDYQVHQMASNDEESGGVGEIKDEGDKPGWRNWTFRRFYAKFKILFHIAIWAVWTA